MLSLGVLHTSHYRLHKKAGMFFLILMYPRPCRAKNGVFSTASSAGAAAVGWHCGDRRHFGVRRGARHACLSRRGLSADPNRRSKATVGLIRCARCVCICPGLLKTPKNARCSPGDPCAQRKPCPCRYPHHLFSALTFLNAGLELVNLPPVWLRGIRFIASSARAGGHLMWPSCEQDCPSRKPYAPPLRSHTGDTAKLSPGIQKI